MSESNQTEKATPERRKKARQQGQVVRSRELSSALVVAVTVLLITNLAPRFIQHWMLFYRSLLSLGVEDAFTPSGPVLFWSVAEILWWVIPTLLVAVVASVGVGLLQGGLNFAPEALAIKVERFSPFQTLSKIFSAQSIAGLLKSLLPAGIMVTFACDGLRVHWSEIAGFATAAPAMIVGLMASIMRTMVIKSIAVLIIWGCIDYVLIWRQNEVQLRMSKEEIKQEYKQSDGNPFTKAQIRKRQNMMRRRKPLQEATRATMVVTNPTHFAVCLRYEPGMRAPEVVAKGRDLLALKIRAIAQDHQIPVMENKPLARTLYKTVEVGDAIPSELYQAVAEILVTVFRAQAELREREVTLRNKTASGEAL